MQRGLKSVVARISNLHRGFPICEPSSAGGRVGADRLKTGLHTAKAFSLLELLIVIGIIALLATIGLPALKGFGQTNSTAAANRQLLDDLAEARLRAINSRSTVYVVFVSPTLMTDGAALRLADDKKQLTNAVTGQYTSYALFSRHSFGDQPGQETPRYLTDWRHLPEGIFIDTNKFNRFGGGTNWPKDKWEQWTAGSGTTTNRPFAFAAFPYPNGASSTLAVLPYVAFDYQGQLLSKRSDPAIPFRQDEEVIPLVRGSIIYPQSSDGSYRIAPAEVIETPRGNSTNTPDRVHIDWLTGRAKVVTSLLPRK